MSKQNYNNYIRWYAPHHFVFYPVMLCLIIFCAYKATNVSGPDWQLWGVAGIGFFCISWLSYMLRQHYALTLQNRLVLAELRYRYFVLTGNRLESFEARLTDEQLFALRFASDQEFELLLSRTLTENLSGTEIKKSIKAWKGDYRRV